MAEVLPPIVQPAKAITMLSHRPSSSDTFRGGPVNTSQQHFLHASMARNHNLHNGMVGYRGASIAPAFAYPPAPYLSQDSRTFSAPGYLHPPQKTPPNASYAVRQPAYAGSSSTSTASSASSNPSSMAQHGPYVSADDTVILNGRIPSKSGSHPLAGPDLSLAGPEPAFSSTWDKGSKPSPDRYRRTAERSASSATITRPAEQQPVAATPSPSVVGAASGMLQSAYPVQSTVSSPHLRSQTPQETHPSRAKTADDLHAPQQASSDQAKRYRRRSHSCLDPPVLGTVSRVVPVYASGQATIVETSSTPHRFQNRESRQPPSPSQQVVHHQPGTLDNFGPPPPASRPHSRNPDDASTSLQPIYPAAREDPRINESPPSGQDAVKPLSSPSPLSRGANNVDPQLADPSIQAVTGATPNSPSAVPDSPAAKQLSALNEKEQRKGVKSRLRRAFSFSSTAELKRVSQYPSPADRTKLKDRFDDNDEEQDAIAQRQEAAGIGNNIYSGQGGVFAGSTDNLSIQTTASSASIMLRKMGQGMKKGGRSLKGLFRAKSVVGVSPPDMSIPEPTAAKITRVNVEAERERVNVNASVAEHAGGGTGFPRLERNSMEAVDAPERGKVSSETGSTRKSIVGSERDRAEVLAAVKKGILKRSDTESVHSSPRLHPLDIPPILLPAFTSPASSGSTTPNYRRTDSMPRVGDDYFSATRLASRATKSMPTTPRGMRKITFNPRIQFYDVWAATEYDRRGEIATCNRLTPILAQQIKEELNSYKMEMEVHELSKPHTHFF